MEIERARGQDGEVDPFRRPAIGAPVLPTTLHHSLTSLRRPKYLPHRHIHPFAI
jgi:hypothetical protein